MKVKNYQLINKEIINNTNKSKFIKEVVLYSSNNLKDFNIALDNVSIFRSARHKNDMPTIFKLGKITDGLSDALIKISENGSKVIKDNNNLIISDHLTIIGSNFDAFVIGYLGGKRHLIRVEINLDKKGNFLSLKVIAEINKILKPKEKFITENVEIYHTDNVNEAIKDFSKKKIKGIKVKNKICPSVYCTWYYYGETINYQDCLINLKKIKERKLPLDTFQIDDGWEDYIGDWKANKKFLDMKKVSKKIKEYHLTPGLWTSPFIMDKKSKLVKKHPEWILKDTSNKPCIFSMNKNEYYIIDITIKKTWSYFKKLYKHLTNDLGFKYHKLDFTRAPITAINPNYKNKNITIIEAYRNAILNIRKGMKDSFFLMCGGLYDPLIGIVDAQRSGSDILSMWSADNKGGKTLPFTMKQSLLRYYMNSWWYNDPDAFTIRRNKIKYKDQKVSLGLLNDNEVNTSVINQLLSNGVFSMTEPLDKIDQDRLDNIYHILPRKEANIELVDLMDSPRYPNLIRINKKFLAIINFDDKKKLTKIITSESILGYKSKINNKITISLLPHASTLVKLTNKGLKEVKSKGHYLA